MSNMLTKKENKRLKELAHKLMKKTSTGTEAWEDTKEWLELFRKKTNLKE